MTSKPAFKVDYECGNCGNEWDETYEPGIHVQRRSIISERVRAGTQVVKCPVCELGTNVDIIDRNPMGD